MTSELPESWESVRLGEVLDDIVGGGTPSKSNPGFFQGSIPLMTVKDMRHPRPTSTGFNITEEALASSSAKLVPEDTIIIATRMGLGKVVRPTMDTAINQDLKALFPNEALDKSYLELWLVSIASKIEAMGTGTTVKGVRLNQIRELILPLAPIEEQRGIVEKIETLFAELDKGEESLRQVQTLLARYRQSVLKAAVTGELTADWRAERAGKLEHGRDVLERILRTRRETWEGRGSFKEPSSPATDDLPGLPDGWVWCSTEQLAQVQTGATPRKAESRFYAGGKVPWITSTAVNSELITEPQDYITDAAIVETNAKLFPAGTLIVAMYGEGKTRGKVSQLGIDAATNQACAALLVEHLPAPVRDFLKAFYLYNYESIRLLSSGGVQPNLNLGLISRTAVPLASEEELSEIGRRIETEFMRIREAEDHCEAAGKRSTALRQSILKEAFSGRLIPQDPHDEPASELLARIHRSQEAGRAAKR